GIETEVRRACAAGEQVALELRLDLALVRDRVEVVAESPAGSLEAREIREGFARDAGEALARLEGVEMLRKGGLGADVVLRGFKGENLNLLIDGHRLHGACPNRMDPPAFHVDFAEIERIEVRKGPFDIRRGGLGGTVDIVTRRPDPGLRASAEAVTGSAGYLAPSLALGYGGARASVKAGYAERRGDPYRSGGGIRFTELLPPAATAAYLPGERDGRAFDVATGWAGIAWHPAAGQRLELAATRQEAGPQLYPYLQMDAEFDDATRALLGWSLQRGGSRLSTLSASLSWTEVDHDMTDRRRVSSAGAPAGYSMVTSANSSVLSGRVEAALAGGWTVGLESWQRGWDAETRLRGMAYRPQATLPDVEARTTGLFAHWQRPLGTAWSLDAGLRLDRALVEADPGLAAVDLYRAYHGTSSISAGDTLPAGHLVLAWAPRESWRLSLGVGRAARVPDPQERYFGLRRAGSDWVGNPGLEPSENSEVDLGLAWRSGGLSLEVDLFAAWIDDAVAVVDLARREPVPGVTNSRARSYVNTDQRLWGGEASVRWALGERWLLSSGVSFVRGRQEVAPERGISDPDSPEIPPLAGRLALRYEGARGFAEVEGAAAARQDRVNAGLGETPTPGWATLALRAGAEAGRFSLLAGVENLFDRDYRRHLSYQRDPFRAGVQVPEPGRTYTLSVRFRR
ncbi:MAG TPA: TonB-dependent receptor, partial [Thermoanaerobaculia bacterium]|nr:TonB-dependent receptor [Thermoanaerobaculia bacterium]